MDTDIAPARPSAAALPAGTGPFAAYEARVASGCLDRDPEQEKAARRLDRLWRELRDYHPVIPSSTPSSGGWLGGLKARLGLSGRAARTPDRPRGVYMVGQVGRGKTMLMDLFFSLAPVEHKRRVHFHRFMQDVHQRLHDMKAADPDLTDPIPPPGAPDRAGSVAALFR